MNVPLLDLRAQFQSLKKELMAAIEEVCDSQQFILGKKVEAFERAAAEYCGAAHAVGVSSGTDALLAALMAVGVGPGDAVLTSPYTFFGTAGSIARLGAAPLFADIDPATFNLDPGQARKILDSPPRFFRKMKIKAVMPVHLFGQCADMNAILDLAAERGMAVVEDAAQAIGAEYPSRTGLKKAGAMGAVGCFSFFPSKNLGCFGDGGMCVTGDSALADELRALRMHGSRVKYVHDRIGGNFRLDALQAAVLEVKLRHLDKWHEARGRNAAFYNRAFAGSPVQTPACVYNGSAARMPHIYNQYVVRVPWRDAVRRRLLEAGIGCEVYYPIPLHEQNCFEYLGYSRGDFPQSEKAAAETLALPIYPELTEDALRAVADAVLGAL